MPIQNVWGPFISLVDAGTMANKTPWHRLPTFRGIFRLLRFRGVLRRENLHDTQPRLADNPPPPPGGSGGTNARTVSGAYNDLDTPAMGSAGTRFGRNVPLEHAHPDQFAILDPNPRTVSRKLMTRHQFQPAEILNLLAAAWIQFQVHDWFAHGTNEPDDEFNIPLQADDPWPQAHRPMLVRRTRTDTTRTPDEAHLPPTYINTETHWWDGSQIYGSNVGLQAELRSGQDGKLKIEADGFLPVDQHGIDKTGVNGNWWLGLTLLHTLFTKEHNAICDRLRDENSSWTDDELFDHARLVNAALMAKIHTVEWTPAILPHAAATAGVKANWYGLFGEGRPRRFPGLFPLVDLLTGIPGSRTDHHAAPYSLTEEFVAVYRMHPLIPDEFVFRPLAGGAEQTLDAEEVAGSNARNIFATMSAADVFYSFGISHPGAVTLHNYPRFLQQNERPDGRLIDLAAIDVLRDRERGVPRYNAFRELMHMGRVETFAELTPNQEWAAEIEEVYGDIDKVDLMVGMFAEQPPEGFGFSDTAFRIFLLMASRRLKSDRFYTVDYRPEIYTQTGIDWVEDNGLASVLLRHFPDVEPALVGVENPFAPWKDVGP